MNCACAASSCERRSRSADRSEEIAMCETCGCAVTPGIAHQHGEENVLIDVLQDLLAANDEAATHNREHFDAHGVLAINLMSSPGAGKTALLEATIAALRSRYRIGVLASGPKAYRRCRSRRAAPVTWMPSSCIGRCMSCPLRDSTCCSLKTLVIW